VVFYKRLFRLLGLKRKIEIFVPDEAFFALYSLSYGVRKRQNLPGRQAGMGQKDHFAANYNKFK